MNDPHILQIQPERKTQKPLDNFLVQLWLALHLGKECCVPMAILCSPLL